MELIEDFWDDILRFALAIKLEETSASDLSFGSFLVLSTILYTALKAFGRIWKSIFNVQFIDDLELRQSIRFWITAGRGAN